MMHTKLSLLRFFLTCLCVFFPSFAFALPQANILLNPENPNPYDVVTLRLSSYSFDVDTANISWTVNGKSLLSGEGEKLLTLRLGGVGQKSLIHVDVSTVSGISLAQEINITPESVDIVYETPESHVPLFYEGKSLPGDGARVRFTAIPNISDGGALVPSKNIAYSWYVNDDYMQSASGIGKQSALLPLSILSESTEIKVLAKSPGGGIAQKIISVYPHAVMPLIYRFDDVLGTDYSEAITRRFEAITDFTLALEPFYLSSEGDLGSSVEYLWSLDGLPVTPTDGKILSLRPKENTFGIKNLTVSVSTPKRRTQKAETTLDLVFDTRK
jgi:hypothetical protein